MIFSEKLSRWEIVNISDNNNVVAHMIRPEGINYPIGLNQWMFLDSNCKDPEKVSRSLLFILKWSNPGPSAVMMEPVLTQIWSSTSSTTVRTSPMRRT